MVIYGVEIIFDFFTVTYFQLNQIVSDPRMMIYTSSAKREIWFFREKHDLTTQSGCRESQFYSLSSGQAVASM